MSEKKQHPDEDQPKSKFKIVDRRRIEDTDAEEAPSEKAPTPAPEKKPEPEPKQVEAEIPAHSPDGKLPDGEAAIEDKEPEAGEFTEDPLGFRSVCLSFIQTLATISWVHMGLLPHPQTQLVVKKIDEARKTIALLEHIFNQVKPEFPPEVNAEIIRLIADLKASYVNQL